MQLMQHAYGSARVNSCLDMLKKNCTSLHNLLLRFIFQCPGHQQGADRQNTAIKTALNVQGVRHYSTKEPM